MSERPPIGSVWRARDGRRVRVDEIVETPHVKGGWWSKLTVLPPLVPRQRSKTSASAESFEDGFLMREPEVARETPFSP